MIRSGPLPVLSFPGAVRGSVGLIIPLLLPFSAAAFAGPLFPPFVAGGFAVFFQAAAGIFQKDIVKTRSGERQRQDVNRMLGRQFGDLGDALRAVGHIEV